MSDECPRGFTYYGKTPSGVEMALHLDIDGSKSPTEIAQRLKVLDSALRENGFTRSDRLDKPAYGGGRPGNARPEATPPADLTVPTHCDEKMIYKPKWTNTAGKEVNARFECRKGKQCADVLTGGKQWPHAEWEDDLRRSGPAGEAPPLRAGKMADTPANGNGKPWHIGSDFWPDARALKFTPEQVTEIAGEPVGNYTKEKCDALLVKLRKTAEAKAAA